MNFLILNSLNISLLVWTINMSKCIYMAENVWYLLTGLTNIR